MIVLMRLFKVRLSAFQATSRVIYEFDMFSWHLRVAGLSLAFFHVLFLLFVEVLSTFALAR